MEEKVTTIVDQFAPFKSQRLKCQRFLRWKSHAASKLIKEPQEAFQEFAVTGFDKTSQASINYKSLRNKNNNAVRDAKKKAMAEVLNDRTLIQWEKIKTFKGTNTDQQNHIQELEIDDVTLTADEKIADGLNKYFSNIGPNLKACAKQAHLSMAPLNHSKQNLAFDVKPFAFNEITNSEVSKLLKV